jgi:hypothetical protein
MATGHHTGDGAPGVVKHGETRGNEGAWRGRRAERAAEWRWDGGGKAAEQGWTKQITGLFEGWTDRSFFFQDWWEGKSFDVPVIDVPVIVSQN